MKHRDDMNSILDDFEAQERRRRERYDRFWNYSLWFAAFAAFIYLVIHELTQ